MTKKDSTQTTVNAGPKADGKQEEREFDVTGNVEAKGQDPSPDDRERGETSDKEAATS